MKKNEPAGGKKGDEGAGDKPAEPGKRTPG